MAHFDLEFESIFPTGTSWRQEYELGEPWPHLVLDDVFEPSLIAAAEQEQLECADELLARRRHYQGREAPAEIVGSASQRLLGLLQSTIMTKLVSEVTGIPFLEPDRAHVWAGVKALCPGGYTTVHRDFPKHPLTGLFHRVNAILYLNHDWQPSYGGALELWDREMRRCEKTVLPVAGRLLIFETTSETLHGIPMPITCPPDRVRFSLAAYYYSAEPPARLATGVSVWPPRRPSQAAPLRLTTLDGLSQAAKRLFLRSARTPR
jgi:hypothetical protein